MHQSKKGWGAELNNKCTGGRWSAEETNDHINYAATSETLTLELRVTTQQQYAM